jgi:hypothetical protein
LFEMNMAAEPRRYRPALKVGTLTQGTNHHLRAARPEQQRGLLFFPCFNQLDETARGNGYSTFRTAYPV